MATRNFGSGETFSTYALALTDAIANENFPLTENSIIQGKGTFQEKFSASNKNNIRPTVAFRLIIRPIPGETLILDGNSVLSRGLAVGTGGVGQDHVDFEDIIVQECTERCLSCDESDNDDINIRRVTLNYNPTSEAGTQKGCLRIVGSTNWTFEDVIWTHLVTTTPGWFSFPNQSGTDNILFKRNSFTGKQGDGLINTDGSEGDEPMQFENSTFVYRSGDTGSLLSNSGKAGFRFCSFLVLKDVTCITDNTNTPSGGTVVRNCIFHMRVGGTGYFFNQTSATPGFLTSNNNIVHKVGPRFARIQATNHDTLAAWRTASGEDAKSITSDPLFFNITEGSEDFRVARSTPGRRLGIPIDSIPRDKDGKRRGSKPTPGAFEALSPSGAAPLKVIGII